MYFVRLSAFILIAFLFVILGCKPKQQSNSIPKVAIKSNRVSDKIKNKPKNKKPVIIIDPGHGGGDPGGRNDSMKIYEKDFTLAIANAILKRLDTNLFTVEATRTTDIEVDRHIRTARVEPLNPDLFISLHCNWAADSLRNGLEFYYYDSLIDYAKGSDTFHFANPYVADLIKYCEIIKKNNKRYIQYMPFRSISAHQDRIWVLYGVSFPSLLIEFGYVTGREDYYVLTDPNQLNMFASVVVKSLYEIYYPHLVHN